MTVGFRKLNEAGISAFREYVRSGAETAVPLHLLKDSTTSEPLQHDIEPGTGNFQDRYMFGIYLRTLFRAFDPVDISGDSGLWSGLALLWFDRLCPPDTKGNRVVRQDYHYILSDDYRHYYRHLVRSPWQLVTEHGEASRFLLTSPLEQKHALSIHGEILEQFSGRQTVLRSRPIIRAANELYFDKEKSRPKRGVAGSSRGSARRFGLVLRQLELTYDPECMSVEAFMDILPGEFDRWRSRKTPT